MEEKEEKLPRKNLKIDEEVHKVLRQYCDSRAIKYQKFVEILILNACKE